MSNAMTPSRFSTTGVLLSLGLVSSAIAWLLIATPVLTFSSAGLKHHLGHFGLTYFHAAMGTILLFLGLANLYIGSTRKHFKYHKVVGRLYLFGGGLGVVAAMVITSAVSHLPGVAHTFSNMSISLLTLSSAWLVAAGMAYRAVRNRRFESHREWMIRSYVLVWAFVFCRLASRVPSVGAMGDGEAFIWLSWVGPLLVAELALQWQAGAGIAVKSSPLRGAA